MSAAFVLGVVVGVVVGVFFAAGWAVLWSLGDAIVSALFAPGFEAHADQAIAVTSPEVPA